MVFVPPKTASKRTQEARKATIWDLSGEELVCSFVVSHKNECLSQKQFCLRNNAKFRGGCWCDPSQRCDNRPPRCLLLTPLARAHYPVERTLLSARSKRHLKGSPLTLRLEKTSHSCQKKNNKAKGILEAAIPLPRSYLVFGSVPHHWRKSWVNAWIPTPTMGRKWTLYPTKYCDSRLGMPVWIRNERQEIREALNTTLLKGPKKERKTNFREILMSLLLSTQDGHACAKKAPLC